MFEWAFMRKLRGLPLSDYIWLKDAGEVLAGSGVSYRQLTLPNGSEITVGIMTGSWTLPAARGRGCFSRIIRESINITAERNGAILLAFVTEDNASCRALLSSGAAAFPTSYFIRQPNVGDFADRSGTIAELPDVTDNQIDEWRQQYGKFVRFSYHAHEDWRAQILRRPSAPRIYSRDANEFVVLEEFADTERILAYLGPRGTFPRDLMNAVVCRAASRNKKCFTFSSDPALSEFCSGSGFTKRSGFLTANIANWELLASAIGGENLRQPVDNCVLTDSQSPWFLGEWRYQSGDRM
jgi:hypothetical protein